MKIITISMWVISFIIPFLYIRRTDLKTMADRILAMRELLFQKLRALGTPGTWTHIINQRGMFSFTGLTGNHISSTFNWYIRSAYSMWILINLLYNISVWNNDIIALLSTILGDQCDLLKQKHIYLLRNGRINLCGLNHNNIDYVAGAIDDVVRKSSN